jgi:hypothetical protein
MRTRRKITLAMLALGAVCVVASAAPWDPLPSDEALRAHFLANDTGFERLVVMAQEDNHLTRIAPDFTWLDDDVAWPRKNVGISEQRWNDYRKLFRAVGASDGILRYSNPTLILFPITSIGSVPSGVEKGLAYSQVSLSPVLKSLDERPPKEFWNGPDCSHLLVYKPFEDHWYIYCREW